MADMKHLHKEAQYFLSGRLYCGAIGMENLLAPLSSLPRSSAPIAACHVLSTLPHRARHGNAPFGMDAANEWTARLSALLWKRYNGSICLMTDPEGARWAREAGLNRVYDEIRDDLDDPYGLNHKKFWAAGKLLAMEKLASPCMIIDMDMMIWRPLELGGAKLAAAHIEHLNDEVYPPMNHFIMSSGYHFPADWNAAADPLNTSVFYMADEELKREYLDEAFRFMSSERDTPDNGSICMVFAEQRILAMCAARRGVRPETLLDFDHLDAPQQLLTHTWSGKRLFRRHPDVEAVYVEICRERCRELGFDC